MGKKKLSVVNAIVADIQHASVHDGPGLRTTVFFKGCPLSCVWCHNPECIEKEPQILFYPEKCIGCGMCDNGCYSGAKVICGKEMSVQEIFSEILMDKAYYGADGGVTFSGGEPMLHSQVLKELISMCKKEEIKTAIETSLILFDEEIFKNIDFVMADFKIWDNQKHKEYTGVYNDTIKENFKKLDALGVDFLVRTPIIPGINDSPYEISSIKNFIKDFKNIKGYELLPYHPLGTSKRIALGKEAVNFKIPENSVMEELRRYADLQG